jgi:hypothetical protein
MKLLRCELTATGMPWVVTVDFGVTFEANWNRVTDVVRTPIGLWNDVIRLDLASAVAITNAASAPSPKK